MAATRATTSGPVVALNLSACIPPLCPALLAALPAGLRARMPVLSAGGMLKVALDAAFGRASLRLAEPGPFPLLMDLTSELAGRAQRA
jgi:hypothetical protein